MPATISPGKPNEILGSQVLTGRTAASLRSAQIRMLVARLVENIYGATWVQVAGPRRGTAQTIRARHIAMYLAHVACGLNLTETGQMFERDRRTVAHAAGLIEDCRENDRHLDVTLEVMERFLTLALSRSSAAHTDPTGQSSTNQVIYDL